MSSVTPYNQTQSKKEQVADMFNNIASNYDFLNHFLSLGIDILWRKKVIKLLRKNNPKKILDIATGTGDFAIEAINLNPESVIGIDISNQMLAVGRKKLSEKNLDTKITLENGDSESLRFDDNSFDAITAGFGVRNFENLDKGLREMYRVLSLNGTVAILEFSQPEHFPIKQLYWFYFLRILPALGKLVSKDSRAYTYLPESVKSFPSGKDFENKLIHAGFKNVRSIPLSFGIASIYLGKKSDIN